MVLGISWHPISPYAHGIGALRNLFAPDCTGISMFQRPAYPPHVAESVRHATVLQREWYTTVRNCLRTCPCPCHGNGTPCNPLNPRNLLQPSDDKELVGKRCAMETEESEGAKSVSHWPPVLHNSLMLKRIRFHTSHNTYNAKSGFGFPTIPIGNEIEGAGEGRKGAGSCPQIVQSGTG